MGNRKNRAKRNTKGRNWRRAIKLRKPKNPKTNSVSINERSEDNDVQYIQNDNFNDDQTDPHSDSTSSSDEFSEVQTDVHVLNEYDELTDVVDENTESSDTQLLCELNELIEVDDATGADTEVLFEIEVENNHLETDNAIEGDVNEYDCDEAMNENEINSIDSVQETESQKDHPHNEHSESDMKMNGRRIVDLKFLFEQFKTMSIHSKDCNFFDIEFVKETRMGLRSILYFKCSRCDFSQKAYSCDKNDESMNVNQAATLGITSIGLGFYHLEEFCAHVGIPCMSRPTFDKENKILQKDWGELAKYHADEALKEEMELAKGRKDVDSSGNPLIAVITDGSWGKRSYGKGFSSLSGCAAIIGLHTKKIVYFGVKNKYCHVCKLSYSKMCPPNQHDCNINYSGPSSGMETEIVVEGFQHCLRLGARINKLIADGDSSTFKAISDLRMYRDPDLNTEKYECVNHLHRNHNSKFGQLEKQTKFKIASRKYVTALLGYEISKGVRAAAKYWRESKLSEMEKLVNLERDCLNAPYHYFGNHDRCNQYFCKKETAPESIDTIELLKSDGLFHEVLNLSNQYFASNVKSLIANFTNNPAEEFNNVIAKYLAGKRLNYYFAGSYESRCSSAEVHYNTKGHAGSAFHKYKFGTSFSYFLLLKMENARIQHNAYNAAMQQTKPRTRVAKDNAASIKGYGDCELPDMTDHAFEVAKQCELAKLEANKNNRDIILQNTIGQKHNAKWFEVRQNLINSTSFGRILNARGPKSYKNILEEILYKNPDCGNTAEIRHQRLYEMDALLTFSSTHKDHALERTGIFIDSEKCFLGASPTRLYGSDCIVVVKCPLQAFKMTVSQAISGKKISFWKLKDGVVSINRKSDWYADIQGQLRITDRRFAHLVVWLGENEVEIKKVERDQDFWEEAEPILSFFFYEAMLKELANPRKARKMDLREFNEEKNTFV